MPVCWYRPYGLTHEHRRDALSALGNLFASLSYERSPLATLAWLRSSDYANTTLPRGLPRPMPERARRRANGAHAV